MFLYCNGDLDNPDHKMVDVRLNGAMHMNNAWYNKAISDYQCVAPNDVGSTCIYKPNTPGVTYNEVESAGVCVLT